MSTAAHDVARESEQSYALYCVHALPACLVTARTMTANIGCFRIALRSIETSTIAVKIAGRATKHRTADFVHWDYPVRRLLQESSIDKRHVMDAYRTKSDKCSQRARKARTRRMPQSHERCFVFGTSPIKCLIPCPFLSDSGPLHVFHQFAVVAI